MAKCEHMFEPSDRCPKCNKERTIQQFGIVTAGEVSNSYRPKPTTKLNLAEAREETADYYNSEKQEEAMKEFITKSFTTELEAKKKKEEDVD